MTQNIDISEWYLDLEELSSLSQEEKDIIHSYYRDMLNCFESSSSSKSAISIFNTLSVSGYIKNIRVEERDKKIDMIYG